MSERRCQRLRVALTSAVVGAVAMLCLAASARSLGTSAARSAASAPQVASALGHLNGSYQAETTITGEDNTPDQPVGDSGVGAWVFQAQCAHGACATMLQRPRISGGTEAYVLQPQQGDYVATLHTTSVCTDGNGNELTADGYDVSKTLTLVPKQTIDGRVTSFTGTLQTTLAPTSQGSQLGCVAGDQTAQFASFSGFGTSSVGHLHVSGTTVSVVAKCAGAVTDSCTDTAIIRAVEITQGGKVISIARVRTKPSVRTVRTLTLGSKSVTLVGGTTQRVKVSLNPAGRRLLARYHHLMVGFFLGTRSYGVSPGLPGPPGTPTPPAIRKKPPLALLIRSVSFNSPKK